MAELHEPSWRKPAGAFAILAIIAGWAVAVATLVDALDVPAIAQALLYLAGGLVWLWLFPMRRLLGWMETGRW